MGVFDNELILPGTITEIVSDYSYGYDTSLFGTTDSVTVIGTAFNGPVGKPVEIYSPEHAKYIFGDTYDYATRREATLVAEIQDAWDRGCRTIYAVRVSGKDIAKDFKLSPETNLKLRVAGMFPSNDNKNICMVYDDTVGASKLQFFKPAKRATIEEKMQGLVENDEAILVNTLELTNSYGLTKDSRLVELIKIVNEHSYNNVLKLSIVDENGNDVTISSKEAQALSVGAMFPGAYFIGRTVNKGIATTNLSYAFVGADGSNKPYDSFKGKVYKKLILNTDINEALPIYGDLATLNNKFKYVSMSDMFDFLAIPGKVDFVFGKDSVDYEEVDISDMDLYKRLGSGYAITAKAELKGTGPDIKIKETPVSDENRIQALNDGIYSMLENLKSDYRVLANGVADAPITGKIPKKEDFKIAVPAASTILGGYVTAKAKIAPTNLKASKQYEFKLDVVDPSYGDAAAIQNKLYYDKVIKRIAAVPTLDALRVNPADTTSDFKNYPNGTMFLVGAAGAFTLYRFDDGIKAITDAVANADLVGELYLVADHAYVVSTDALGETLTYTEVTGALFGTSKFVLIQSDDTVAVYEIIAAVDPEDPVTFEPVGGLDEIFNDNDDKTLITTQSEYGVVNDIVIKSSALDYTTLEEFVEILNADASLGKYFEFSISNDAIAKKDEYVLELQPAIPTGFGAVINDKEKDFTYNLNLYIPYKTTDNFARHLAQHCTYTSLKTAPTHGVIGCSKLMDVNLNSVANKVTSVSGLDLNLYAKKPNGRDMLDRNNLPYPIGRNISVVLGQYVIEMGDGYSYISNGASGYAGMVSVLPLDQSSTSQTINIPTPQYDLTNFQLEKLTQKGFVTFKQSYTKGYVVTDGITMAPTTSTFRRLNITRIVNAIEEVIRSATEPFIGKQNHLANRNSMQTSIKSSLETLKGKLIEDFDFKLTIDPANTKLGIVDIDYTIVPIYEIREVRNRISVKESI